VSSIISRKRGSRIPFAFQPCGCRELKIGFPTAASLTMLRKTSAKRRPTSGEPELFVPAGVARTLTAGVRMENQTNPRGRLISGLWSASATASARSDAPLFWVFALVAAGNAVLHPVGVPGMLAHQDQQLPTASTRRCRSWSSKILREHVPHGFAKYYFYFQKLMGWVLASFLDRGTLGPHQVALASRRGGVSDHRVIRHHRPRLTPGPALIR
jgi:hypothetical protein